MPLLRSIDADQDFTVAAGISSWVQNGFPGASSKSTGNSWLNGPGFSTIGSAQPRTKEDMEQKALEFPKPEEGDSKSDFAVLHLGQQPLEPNVIYRVDLTTSRLVEVEVVSSPGMGGKEGRKERGRKVEDQLPAHRYPARRGARLKGPTPRTSTC
jgi:hypothetical protein